MWLKSHILTHAASRLYCMDTFAGNDEHREMALDLSFMQERLVANVAPLEDRVRVFQGPSRQVLHSRRLRSGTFHFAYVDGPHRASPQGRHASLSPAPPGRAPHL